MGNLYFAVESHVVNPRMTERVKLATSCKRKSEACYRPQRSWAKVMFLQACVCPQGGGVSASVHAGIPPGSRHPPLEQTPPLTRPPRTRHPPGPGTTPLDQAPPRTRHTPPLRESDCSIRLTSGRYASYWNAFLWCIWLLCRSTCIVNVEVIYFNFQHPFQQSSFGNQSKPNIN